MDTSKPSVLTRYQVTDNVGIQIMRYSRNAIGYIEQGRKLIHQGDKYIDIRPGEVFHLESGVHYIENSPAGNGEPFRETLFFYASADLRKHFSKQEKIAQTNQLCATCQNATGVYSYPASPILAEFFRSAAQYIEAKIHLDPELGQMKLNELVQLLLTTPGCCVCRPIGTAVTHGENTLSEVVRNSYLTDTSIAELARQSGMSLSMFKNEFRKQFNTTPHKWITEQRLAHARLQLLTTNRSIADIADECRFNNSSHFIKLFKERFDTTPALYRRTQRLLGTDPLRPVSGVESSF